MLLKRAKPMALFSQTICSNNSFTLIENNFRLNFEFKVTMAYGQNASSCDPLNSYQKGSLKEFGLSHKSAETINKFYIDHSKVIVENAQVYSIGRLLHKLWKGRIFGISGLINSYCILQLYWSISSRQNQALYYMCHCKWEKWTTKVV